jgi:hypothetical protein
MDLDKGIILNKYGAVDVSEIVEMQKEINYLRGRCLHLEHTLVQMAGLEIPKGVLEPLNVLEFELNKKIMIRKLINDMAKLRELTHADDYEWQETPATKKLVKKDKK